MCKCVVAEEMRNEAEVSRCVVKVCTQKDKRRLRETIRFVGLQMGSGGKEEQEKEEEAEE